MDLIYENILMRLLVEGDPATAEQQAQGLAAYVQDGEGGNSMNVTLYDINGFAHVLKQHKVENPRTRWGPVKMFPILSPHLRGYIEIHKADSRGHGRCYDAWEVGFSAGPRIGELLYGLGFALTDNGKLTPDRKSVSPGAQRRWKIEGEKRLFTKNFDDVTDPKTKPEYDDCIIHDDSEGKDPEVLNHAYHELGWERGMLEKLRKQHARLKKYMITNAMTPEGENIISQKDFESIEVNLPYFGSRFFNTKYR